MKFLLASFLICLSASLAFREVPADSRFFELRIYYSHPGKLDALIERFQNHTTALFEKHGMENIGYWVPVSNEKNALYYILAFPDKKSRKDSWTSFSSDPEWKRVLAKSEAGGKLIDSISSVFIEATDILPAITSPASGGEHLYELRTYTCLPGRLPNLITRFKDHTVKLFQSHAMENVVYFSTYEEDSAQPKLVYLLAHSGMDAATKSWADFRSDPNWIKARDASEKDGKIVEKLASVYLKPLSFSKLK